MKLFSLLIILCFFLFFFHTSYTYIRRYAPTHIHTYPPTHPPTQIHTKKHIQATAAATQDISTGLDHFYLIYAGALVFFMQLGFAMLCAGSIRAKNVKNVLLWNLMDSCGGGLAFWVTGYAFAYGGEDDSPQWTFIGHTNFFLMGDDINLSYWFFQFAFACAVSSIVAGTIAERTQMKGYLFYSMFLVGFVYPVVAHAFWSTNGFLANTNAAPLWNSGAIDFAGSGPVHMLGGVTALMAAIILGPRLGRFHDEDGQPLEVPNDIPGHRYVNLYIYSSIAIVVSVYIYTFSKRKTIILF
jgi:Amt family ammonium transporter